MGRVTVEVWALLQERQDRRKAELDTSRRDVQFDVEDEVFLDTEHTPLPLRLLVAALPAPLRGPRAHCAKHVPPRHTRQMARLPRKRQQRQVSAKYYM